MPRASARWRLLANRFDTTGMVCPTGDLDLWVEPTPPNALRVMAALGDFGAPLDQVTAEDFSQPGIVFQMGLPPRRIDFLTERTALNFADAWAGRLRAPFGPITADFLGREAVIANTRALGRAKDLGDRRCLDEQLTATQHV